MSQNLTTPASAERVDPPKRVVSIQYLRAIAAMSVVAYHASKRVGGHLPEPLVDFFHLGHGGVDLFFVISGFIMWSIGCNAPREPKQFLLRRLIRVVPLYWIATLSWVFIMLALGFEWITLSPGHVLKSLLFVPHWSPTFPDTFWPVLVPGWTLIFEMFFYCLFAVALTFSTRWRLVALSASLLVFVSAGVFWSSGGAIFQAYTSPLLLDFLSGCLIAEFLRRGACRPWSGVPLILAGLLVLLFLAPFAVPDQTSWSRPLTFGLSGALIVLGAVSLEHRMPALPLLERLGDASYAIYLFHLILFIPLVRVWGALPSLHGPLGALCFIAATVLLASCLGLIIFRCLERPLQKWLRRLLYRESPHF